MVHSRFHVHLPPSRWALSDKKMLTEKWLEQYEHGPCSSSPENMGVSTLCSVPGFFSTSTWTYLRHLPTSYPYP